jgi:hypothetical protein
MKLTDTFCNYVITPKNYHNDEGTKKPLDELGQNKPARSPKPPLLDFTFFSQF